MPYYFVISCLLIFASPAYATKPCPPSPCLDQNGLFDPSLCAEKADWVAIGTVSKLKVAHLSYPLDIDQYTFTFTVNTTEKWHAPKLTMMFTTGWCHNPIQAPLNTAAKIRLFGLNQTDPADQKGAFLYYQILEKTSD